MFDAETVSGLASASLALGPICRSVLSCKWVQISGGRGKPRVWKRVCKRTVKCMR